jgi:hypothetical protein
MRRRGAASGILFVQPDAVWVIHPDDRPARCHPGVDEALAALPGGAVRVVLSGRLTHQLLVHDAAHALPDEDAVAGWARHQFTHYHGAVAQGWSLALWRQGAQRGACALVGLDLPVLEAAARRRGVPLLAVQPWWAVALHALGREAATLALAADAEVWLIEGVHATRLRSASGQVVAIEQHWLEGAQGHALVTGLASRTAPAPACWVVGYGLDGDVPLPPSVRCPASLAGERPLARWLQA